MQMRQICRKLQIWTKWARHLILNLKTIFGLEKVSEFFDIFAWSG